VIALTPLVVAITPLKGKLGAAFVVFLLATVMNVAIS